MSMTKQGGQQDRVNDIIERASRLTAEEKRKLLSMGCVFPNAAGGDPTVQKWAYRCPHCGSAGLYFIGERFLDTQGNEVERPQPGMPIDLLPWKQDKPLHEINRNRPTCQSCNSELPLNGRGLISKHIVAWSDFVASRNKVLREIEQKRADRSRSGLADRTGAAEGLTQDFARSQTMQKPSQYLSADAKQDIAAMDAAGLTAQISRG